jgi:integrase
MGRPKLPEGLTWRERPDGTYYEDIYFNKQYRGRRIRGSAGTAEAKEAERRLRQKLQEIDNAEIYGQRPDRTFAVAAAKFLDDYPEAARYEIHLASLMPYIGSLWLRQVSKQSLKPWIEARYKEKVSARTINWGLEAVRRILRLAAYYWRDEYGLSWIDNAPIIELEKGPKLLPYPLSWEQQDALFARLTDRMRDMCLFAVNTGLRDQGVVRLRWDWETDAGIGETVFVVPGSSTKNGKTHYVVLNSEARRVIERYRGKDDGFVFGEPKDTATLTNRSWQLAWATTIGKVPGYLKGVHNLRHTFGKRLRDAGVDERDVQDLLHHMPKTVTRHYSQPELRKLRECVERIVRKPLLRAVG